MIGDKVSQAFSNHAEGTVIAVFKDRAGEYLTTAMRLKCGHRTIQIASEGSLVAAPSLTLQETAANASLIATFGMLKPRH